MNEVIALCLLASIVGFALSSGVLGGYFIATGRFIGIDFGVAQARTAPLHMALSLAAGPALVLQYIVSNREMGATPSIAAALAGSVWSLTCGLLLMQALLSL
jgi:hypothetical protein